MPAADKAVVDLREERNARLIPRDPRRAQEYEDTCAKVVLDVGIELRKAQIPWKCMLIAFALHDDREADRLAALIERRNLAGMHVIETGDAQLR